MFFLVRRWACGNNPRVNCVLDTSDPMFQVESTLGAPEWSSLLFLNKA
jgi:hypothetical protein